jgi:lipid-binding SYLF domain-containing protein
MLENAIHAGAESTLAWLTAKDPGLKDLIAKSYGYAVFPAVGRAGAVLGLARGHGAVFEHGKPIGFATVTQVTVGAQVGGQTFSELVVFGNKDALEPSRRAMSASPRTHLLFSSRARVRRRTSGPSSRRPIREAGCCSKRRSVGRK